MSNNFYKILTEILLSIVIAILLPTIGMLFWLLKDNSGNIILTLLIALLIIVLFVVLYYYYKNCTSSTELIVLKLIQESTDVTNVIENIIRTDLTTKVEVIWYKEIQTQVEEYNSSLERYETVLKNIEDILHKEIIEDIFIRIHNASGNLSIVLINENEILTFANFDVTNNQNYYINRINQVTRIDNTFLGILSKNSCFQQGTVEITITLKTFGNYCN